ncbi:dentin sialophosphoprotein [Spatholobus suberectus]|nr:dentin sialophosphoprotein [Spatholobus suberectus]
MDMQITTAATPFIDLKIKRCLLNTLPPTFKFQTAIKYSDYISVSDLNEEQIRIFWSSEQNHLRCVNKEEEKGGEKKVEPKHPPKTVKNERRGLLYKCPSHNATSRRRNFTGKKLDVYGGLEIKAKDLSSVFRNEFTRNNRDIRRAKFYKEEIGSLEAPTKQALFAEPSMLDLVTYGVGCDGLEKKTENKEDEKKAQQDGNKGVELTEEDQKNEMDLGTCELERHKRLESLIARRRARKQLKLQIEKGLIDMKSVTPSQIAPLFVTRLSHFDSPKEFDGIEMPGSAPSALRSPFDIPYDPFEEKPNLTGDSFDQELKDLLIEPRQEDLEAREHRFAHPRVRRLRGDIDNRFVFSSSFFSSFPPSMLMEKETKEETEVKFDDKIECILLIHAGKGNHDKLEQLISKEASESESKASIPPSEGEETAHEENGKCEIDNMAEITGEEVDNAQATKSNLDHSSEPDLISVINVERGETSEKLEEPRVPKPQEGDLNLPISSTSATKINDSLYESLSSPVDKNQENITGGPISHTPSCSFASDLQVEVSEVGSPTLTVDENHETTTTTDGESMIYDGDIDKDVTSGSEDMWGASLHLREVRRVSEQDISEVNSWRDICSPLSLQNIDEENAADVSSMSSRSDMPDDTPTYAMSSDHNIFGKDFGTEKGASQPTHSSVVSARWKRLMRLMDTRLNHSPHKMHSEKPGELFNLSENSSKAQVVNDGNNSTASEQDNTHNSRGNEEPGASDAVMQQEATDEVSINSSSSSSPRSVLSITQKTIADQVPSSAYNQETHLDVQQSNMQDVAQEILNGEGPLDSIPQNILPSIDNPNVESHHSDLNHPQEETSPLENSIQESNISSKMNDAEVCNEEAENKLKNDENGGDIFTPLIRQDASREPPRQAEMMASEDISEESREMFDDKVPLISLILESSLESPGEDEEKSEASVRQEATTEPCISAETTDTSSDEDFERKCSDLNENEAILSSSLSAGESDKLREIDKPKHSSGVNYLQSESMQVVEDHMEKEKLDKGDISEDSLLPIATEVTNSEDTEGECDKNEATEQELNKNETVVMSEPAGESDQVRNIAHMKDPEERTST